MKKKGKCVPYDERQVKNKDKHGNFYLIKSQKFTIFDKTVLYKKNY